MKKALRWILLVVVLVAAWEYFPREVLSDLRAALPGGNGPELAIANVECIPDAGMPRAEVRVRNMGEHNVSELSGVVRFAEGQVTGRFVPKTIAPGEDATMTAYADSTNVQDCELQSVTDGAGRKAELSNKARFTNPRDRARIL